MSFAYDSFDVRPTTHVNPKILSQFHLWISQNYINFNCKYGVRKRKMMNKDSYDTT